MKDLRDETREEAKKRVKTRVLVAAVADAENITASEEDVQKELELMAAQYKMEAEKIREMMDQLRCRNGNLEISVARQDTTVTEL